jgi:hypothetical protein
VQGEQQAVAEAARQPGLEEAVPRRLGEAVAVAEAAQAGWSSLFPAGVVVVDEGARRLHHRMAFVVEDYPRIAAVAMRGSDWRLPRASQTKRRR